MLKRLIESHADQPQYEHSVVSLTDLGEIGPELRLKGVEVSALGMRGALDMPVVLYALTMAVRRLRPDIVQTWMYHADLLGGLASRLAGCRNLVWGIRTTDVGLGGNKGTLAVRRICAMLSHSLPKRIVCAAEASRKAHAQVGYDNSRMLVIPNGFEPERLVASLEERAAIRAVGGITPNDVVVGTVGRFVPVKDHANFIEAAALLCSKYPHAKFLMVGRGLDHDNRALVAALRSTGCSPRFVLLGERQDVPACLKAMDIFCLHSRTEGFPNVLGEAMAMGLPCVSTDVGDAALLLDEVGTVVPAQNAQALARGLEKMIVLSAAERAIWGMQAQARLLSSFTMTRASARFAQVYQELLHSRGKEHLTWCS